MKTAHERTSAICESLNLPATGVAYLKIKRALQEQDSDTRHACAEAVIGIDTLQGSISLISKDAAHNACMNAKAT